MDPKRTREALDRWHSGDESVVFDAAAMTAILNDASRWVGLFEECENCESFGNVRCGKCENDQDGFEDFPCHDPMPCPSCKGRGFSLNQERLERAAKALYKRLTTKDEYQDSALAAVYERDAEAAILAFLLEGPE